MTNNSPLVYIAIIFPYPSAQYLAECLASDPNTRTIALYPKDFYSNFVHMPWDYTLCIDVFDTENCIKVLEKFKIDFVLNGHDLYQSLTDSIATKLTPNIANDPKTSLLRQNKYHIHKALAEAGLPHIKQELFAIGTKDSKETRFSSFQYPVFVKPLEGAGSVGAKKVHNRQDLDQYFADARHNTSLAHTIHRSRVFTEYLVCEHIIGDLYLIDSFSYNGVHHICSLQKYAITQDGLIQFAQVVTDTNISKAIQSYTISVLNVAEFQFGFAHTEVFLTATGPVLCEINPRISGASGYPNFLNMHHGLPTQPQLLLAALHQTIITKRQYMPTVWVVLYHYSLLPLGDIERMLEAFQPIQVKMFVENKNFQRTYLPTNFIDAIACVILGHADPSILEKSLSAIIEQDKKGWYTV
jgi:ATP-grasp domain